MPTIVSDLRYALRMLVKNPGFAAAAVVVLALGIGANTAVFSLVNAFLIKPLAVQKPEELVSCYSHDPKKKDASRAFSYPNYTDLRASNTAFSSLLAHNLAMVGLTEGAVTRRVFADVVSSNYFSTLGVSLFRGRAFTAEEERPGSGIPVVILSYPLWKRIGADQDILGGTLRVNGTFYKVAGIAPEGFTGTTAIISPELFLPLGMYERAMNDFEGRNRPLAARDNHCLMLLGRLRPHVTLAAADSQLALAAAQLERAYPAENKSQTFFARPPSRLSVSTAPHDDSGVTISAILLLGMAAVVLLIASLNVANMMLARGAARRKEIAIRLALGSSRRNILQQLLTESLVLALLGGAAGLMAASWSTTLLVRSLTRLAPIDLVYNASPDLRVLGFTLAFCVAATLLFGFVPAWNLSRPDVLAGIKGAQEQGGTRRRILSQRNLLVMGQLALSLALLTAAGLFLRSAQHAADVQPGFQLAHSVVAEFDPSLAGYNETRGRQIYRALLDRFRSIPGVQSTALATTVPFGMISLGRAVEPIGDPARRTETQFNIVSEDYFRTLGIPLLRGRAFQTGESGSVAIIDQATAARLWPNGDPLGRHLQMFPGESQPARDVQVVGVVGDVQERLLGARSEGHLYIPFGHEYLADSHIHLRLAPQSEEAEARVTEAVRREIRAVDPNLPVLALKTLRQHLDESMETWIVRTGARMFTLFGFVALLLATVGLYAVTAYTVARRTREIGIRMALGANAADAQRVILREGVAVTAVGVGIGLALSLMLGRLLATMLYRVNGADPLVLTAAPACLSAIALLACYVPARRAARVDPMVALRWE